MSVEYPITIGGVSCIEPNESWQASFSNVPGSQASAKRKLRCAWADHVTLLNYLLNANNFTVAGNAFVIGHQHPKYTGLYANGVSIEPFMYISDAESSFTNDSAVLEVSYAPADFNPAAPEAIRTDTIQVCGEVIPLPKESMDIDDDHKMAYDDGLYIPYLKYTATLHGVSAVPLGAIMGCLNQLSTGNMTIKTGNANTYSVPGDQVLYTGPEGITKTIMSNGQIKFDVSHSFLIAPISMNKVYDHKKTDQNILDRFVLPKAKKYKSTSMAGLGV